MPVLNCFKIRSSLSSKPQVKFDDFVDPDTLAVAESTGTQRFSGFTAQTYLIPSHPHPVAWASFIESGFPALRVGTASSPSALMLVRANSGGNRRRLADPVFAFAFGTSGRHMIRSTCYERNFGLRTALNVIYPRSGQGSSRIRSIDTKQRGSTVMRKRQQSSELSDFNIFGVNRMRDVLSKASGVPADTDLWGKRVTGGDSLSIDRPIQFSELGDLCRSLDAAHSLDDYREQFDWIDYIRPITDPSAIAELEMELLARLRARDLGNLALAPPEILDWEHVARFRFSFDRTRSKTSSDIQRVDIRLPDWVTGMRAKSLLDNLDMDDLRSQRVIALDGDGREWKSWPVAKCLVGEMSLNGATYILDEGDFFSVRADYINDLDQVIDSIPISSVTLPDGTPTMVEADYNRLAADAAGHLLLDRQTIRLTGQSPVEICDLLSKQRHLIHVKRHLGSSDLSHLFAQGFVSAESLQMSTDFRSKAQEKINAVSGGNAEFDFFENAAVQTSEFEIVYAIVERWNGRSMSAALPFFSKVNLREVNQLLTSRGFRVSMKQVEAKLANARSGR